MLVWWGFEFGDTLIGAEVRRGQIRLSPPAAAELKRFRELFPEWLQSELQSAYLSIPRDIRRERLAIIYGDLPLAVEPGLGEIPSDLYRRLRYAKLCGGPALLRGNLCGPVVDQNSASYNSRRASHSTGGPICSRKFIPEG